MSKLFRDSKGREWIVSVTITTARRLREKLEIDILENVGLSVLEKLASDPIQLANVLFVCCEKQAAELKVSDEDFGEALSGDTLEAGSLALMEAIADFFPQSKRLVLQNALAKHQTMEQAASARAITILNSGVVEQEMDRTWNEVESKLSKTTGDESP